MRMSTMSDISFVPKGATNNFQNLLILRFKQTRMKSRNCFYLFSGLLLYIIPPPYTHISKIVSIITAPPPPPPQYLKSSHDSVVSLSHFYMLKCLHSLQPHVGPYQVFIMDLKSSIESAVLRFSGNLFQSLAPSYRILRNPYMVVCTLGTERF